MMIPSHCRKPSAWLADDSTVFYRRFDKSPASHPSPAPTSNSHPSPQHLWTCRVFKNRGARKLEAQTRCHPPVCGANSWPPVRDVWSPHLLQTLSKHPSPQEAQHLRPRCLYLCDLFHARQQRSILYNIYILLLLRLWNKTTGVEVRRLGGVKIRLAVLVFCGLFFFYFHLLFVQYLKWGMGVCIATLQALHNNN